MPAVAARQPEIEQDGVIRDSGERVVRRGAVGEPVDRESQRAQATGDAVAEQQVVFDVQYAQAPEFTAAAPGKFVGQGLL